MTDLLKGLLPDAVVAVETRGDAVEVSLFPEEAAVIAGAVEKRRREFATVRHCARAALAGLGIPPAPILPGERGAPSWPDGIVGSMTHCAGFCAAAVARRRDVLTVGLDAEPAAPLPEGILESITRPEESHMLDRLAAQSPDVHWDRLLFSAKESIYKAWFPLVREWLGFEEAVLDFDSADFDSAAGTFTATLLKPGPVRTFAGRWTQRDGIALTAIAVPAD